MICNVNNYITSFITYYYIVSESSELCNVVSNVIFYLVSSYYYTIVILFITKGITEKNYVGVMKYVRLHWSHSVHFSISIKFRYIVCVCLHVLCKFCSRLLQVFLVKEYKGCPMLNQNDFSDKILHLHFLSLKVFFIHQCHETCFYLPLSRGMITNMLSIQIVTNSCGTFLFRIVP